MEGSMIVEDADLSQVIRGIATDLDPERSDYGQRLVQLIYVAVTALQSGGVGSCDQDGTSMYYVGRTDGLYVCCGGNPQHCWKLA
jgi:hypothetical protein